MDLKCKPEPCHEYHDHQFVAKYYCKKCGRQVGGKELDDKKLLSKIAMDIFLDGYKKYHELKWENK